VIGTTFCILVFILLSMVSQPNRETGTLGGESTIDVVIVSRYTFYVFFSCKDSALVALLIAQRNFQLQTAC